MADIFLPPQIAVRLPQALDALARKAERGEVRTFHIVYVDDRGRAHEAFKLDPARGNRDLNIIGNVMIDRVEKFSAFVDSKQKIHIA